MQKVKTCLTSGAVWALFLIVAATGTAVAQQSIQLSTGSLPLTEVSRLAALRPDAQAGRQGNRYFFIARFSRFDAVQREAWQREGLLLGHRLDGQTWWVSAPQQPVSSWLQGHNITAIAFAPPEAKTSRLLAGNQAPAWARNANGTISLVVETELTAGEQNARGWLQQAGFAVAKPITQSPALWQVEVRPGDISRLAALPFVTYVQPINPPDQPINDRSRYFASAPLLNNALPAGRGLNGQGVTVGVGDDSYPINHPDVMDRIIDHTPAVSGFTANRLYRHGAHVSGTVLGGGILSPERAGFAPQATLLAQWFSGVWLNAADYTALYNMVVTNNSYGAVVGDCGYTGQYDLYAQQLDQQAFNFPQLLHVFAAGNSGGDVCSPFPPGYQTVLGGYQSAKNVITVANADGQNIFSSSSAGPVRDGRLKPEIAAQGTNVLSTDAQYPSNAYYNEIGTSMSSPAVAGGLALLYQRYRQLNANANPPGALMKTLLLNGASDRGTPGPDYRWGYGFMNLQRSLLMMEGNQYAERQVSQSSTQEITISVPAGTSTLKVMLYWHDPSASPLAAKTLVNDLDLEVITPGGQTLLPLVLNANPAAVAQPAQPGTDRINNSEQVVIPNPQPGTYTLRMRGFDVPAGPQTAYLAYDFLPTGIDLQVPAGGETYSGNVVLAWEDYAVPGANYLLEYSTNNGSTWGTLASDVPAATRLYTWTPPADAFPSAQVRIRVSRQGAGGVATSQAFSLLPAPAFSPAPNAEQCEGYLKLNWTGLAGIDSYDLVMKQGTQMLKIANVTADGANPTKTYSYTFAGLSKDSTYFVAVRAVKNGVQGNQQTALAYLPNTGGCTGSISNGDLRLDSIVSPLSGRQFTTMALTAATGVTVRVKNLDDAAVSSYKVLLSINGATPAEITASAPLAAGATALHNFAGNNLADPGTYTLKAWVVNTSSSDPLATNDTAISSIVQLANAPIALPFADGFDNATSATLNTPATGLAGLSRWDYLPTTARGRLRTTVPTNTPRSGNRAITLDVSKAFETNKPTNYLTGTFNLAPFAGSTQEIRLDFAYKHHGNEQKADSANRVWVRGSDTQPWIPIYNLHQNQLPVPGVWNKTLSIELSDSLAKYGQALTTSTQVRFGQYAPVAMADNTHFGGYSFDDVRLYLAQNDAQLLEITDPTVFACENAAGAPVSIRVRNSVATDMTNLTLRYRVNGGPWVSQNLPLLAGNTTSTVTFGAPALLSGTGPHTIEAEVLAAGDNVPDNNNLSISVRNQPVISTFPYLQDFESGDGSWYSAGTASSWQLGTPASLKIKSAASGLNAWKTTLAGNYNDQETSYLYSPCFNLNGLTNPTLSFMMAYDLEDCTSFGSLCDAAWVEYSSDGKTWTKLGANGQGTNWYDVAQNVWTKQNQTWWHVATIPLPVATGPLQLRFVLNSDEGVAREGLAIDDIHIFSKAFGIAPTGANSNLVTTNIGGAQPVHVLEGTNVLATILPEDNNLGSTTVQTFWNNGAIRSANNRFYGNRNLVIKPANRVTNGSTRVRFYFTDAEVNALRSASGCGTCSNPTDVTALGVPKYTDENFGNEDGSLANNTNGQSTFISTLERRLVPYDNGYYVEFAVSNFSEFWLSDGPLASGALALNSLQFSATRSGPDALLRWTTTGEQNMRHYIVQTAISPAGPWRTLATVAAANTPQAAYSYTDKEPHKSGTRYYRLQQADTDGKTAFSPVRTLAFGAAQWIVQLYPNPMRSSAFLHFEGALTNPICLRWTNAAGQVISSQCGLRPEYGVLRVQPPARGVYLLHITDGNKIHVIKAVVH